MTLKERLIHFLDDIRDYERESQELICYDERDSSELVDIYLESKVNNGVLDGVIKCEHTFGERGHHGDKYYACIKCGEIK